jgi:hypothetical protein
MAELRRKRGSERISKREFLQQHHPWLETPSIPYLSQILPDGQLSAIRESKDAPREWMQRFGEYTHSFAGVS